MPASAQQRSTIFLAYLTFHQMEGARRESKADQASIESVKIDDECLSQ